MAAYITADPPQSVYVPFGQPSGLTNIKWSTDSNNRGKVTVSVDDGAEQWFDGDPVQGSLDSDAAGKYRSVKVGEKQQFFLRRANAAKTLLASVTVRGRQSNLLPGVDIVDQVIAEKARQQVIFALTIIPRLNDAEFRFSTTLETVPVVEVFRDDAQTASVAAVFPIFGGLRTDHVLGIGGEPRLPQGTELFFRIFAAAPTGYRSPAAVLRGSFVTARQDVTVIFDRIFMLRDGDPRSAGDMQFDFGVGDAETKARLGHPRVDQHFEDVGDGENAYPGKQFFIPNAPRRLWAEVAATDNDQMFPFFWSECLTRAAGATTGSWETDIEESAWVWAELDTFADGAMVDGMRETPFWMSTGNFGIAFHVHGRLRVADFPGAVIKMWSHRKELPRARSHGPGNVLAVSGVVRNGKASGAKLSALGLDGGVYVKSVSEERPRLRDQWTRLGGDFAGSLTAVATDETRLDLFALDAAGAVFHRSHADGDAPEGDWRALGGAFVGELAAAIGREQRIELFGADCDGSVHHLAVVPGERRARPRKWEHLGGRVSGSPVAVQAPGDGVGVFALGDDGEVLHKRRDGGEWRPGATDWDRLGGHFEGKLDAKLLEDGNLRLVVLSPDRMVHTLLWKDYPRGTPEKRWHEAGTLDLLFQSLVPDLGETSSKSSARASVRRKRKIRAK